jgi:hypothetical protein
VWSRAGERLGRLDPVEPWFDPPRADAVSGPDHAGRIVAAALAGDRLATWDGSELVVRRIGDGRVALRMPLRSAWDWSPEGEPRLLWFGDRLAVIGGPALLVVDPTAGVRYDAAPSELLAGTTGTCTSDDTVPAGVRRIAVAPGSDGRVSASLERVTVGDVAIRVAPDHEVAVALAPDGRFAVAVDGVAELRSADGAVIAALTSYGAEGMAFAPDGRLFVGRGGSVVGFDANGRQIAELGHGSGVAVDADGGRLVTFGDGRGDLVAGGNLDGSE